MPNSVVFLPDSNLSRDSEETGVLPKIMAASVYG
jgi:hypothetical protein